MAESVQIQSISHRHEAIIAFLVANPDMKKADVARHFGVTPAWFSTLIHSDVFKERLGEQQDKFFSAATQPIAEKLDALASIALDKALEKVEVEEDIGEVRMIAQMALDRLGYNPGNGAPQVGGGQTNIQNNIYAVTPEQLSGLRENILTRGSPGRVLEQPAERIGEGVSPAETV